MLIRQLLIKRTETGLEENQETYYLPRFIFLIQFFEFN